LKIADYSNLSYEEELELIIEAQNRVLEIAPVHDGIPLDQAREPKQLFLRKKGLCYDRSRTIEKILRYYGFATRHIAVFSTEFSGSAFRSMLIKFVPSHAVTEVKTQKGWLVVDSNFRWISISKKKTPISIEEIHQKTEKELQGLFLERPKSRIFLNPFTFYYGLYSRHGHFYPPYNFVPDINVNDFFQNIIG
jgi:hypothetical protein